MVKLAPEAKELVKCLSGIFGLEQWPSAAANRSLEKRIRACIQPGYNADLFEGLTVGRAKDETAPRGENDAADSHQFLKGALFHVAKVVFPIPGENLRNITALTLNNELVGIKKAMSGESGETTAH
jgi:hypothetical protein